jgi:hypothetical protein
MLTWNKYHQELLLTGFLVLTLILGSTGSARAGTETSAAIGNIIAIRGQATAVAADGVSRPLALKAEIGIGDLVKTDRHCRLQIMFADSTIVSLGPASEFVVKDYAWDAKTLQGKMTSRVNEGVFRILGGSITKTSPMNFTTETPSATIGIRGSMYAGKVHAGRLDVVFQGGKGIYLRNALGTVDILIPGFGLKGTEPDKPLGKPVRFTPADLEGLNPLTAAAPQPSESGGDTAQVSPAPPVDTQVAPEEGKIQAAPLDSLRPSVDPPAQTVATDILTETLPLSTGDTVTETSPLPAGGTATLSGRFMAVQDDRTPTLNIADLIWLGSLNGQTAAGQLTSTAVTNNGTFAISPFTVNGYDPTLPYAGATKVINQPRTVSLLSSSNSFSVAETLTDTGGEFSVFTLDTLFNGDTYVYRELGFLGTPTTTLPSAGISRFVGPLVGTLDSVIATDFEVMGDLFSLGVNWHNGKVFGAVIAGPQDKASGFFIGTVSGTGVSISQFFGNDVVDPGPGSILAISGSSSFGQFYGNQASGIGVVASGSTHNILSQVTEENWQFSAGGFRNTPITPASTGTVIWEGFAIGVGEDMNQIAVDRRLFMNQTANDFSLTINRDSGNINGSLNATDAAGSGATINSLQFGGTNGSAYLSDRILATGIGGGTPIFVSPGSGPLKTYGNYLLTENTANQLASYVSWGIWEIAYSEPGSGDDYHVHMPGSLWVAGELTSPTDFASLNFTASYNCRAEGVHVPSAGQYNNMPTGSATFNVDFGTGMLTSGAINFPAGNGAPAIVLGVDPASVSSAGFSANVSTPNLGSVNGAFFGPGAASVAGNFAAQVSGDQVIGVFGGDR